MHCVDTAFVGPLVVTDHIGGPVPGEAAMTVGERVDTHVGDVEWREGGGEKRGRKAAEEEEKAEGGIVGYLTLIVKNIQI